MDILIVLLKLQNYSHGPNAWNEVIRIQADIRLKKKEAIAEAKIECLKILGKKKVNELINKCDFTLPLKLNKEQHQQHQEKTEQEHQE